MCFETGFGLADLQRSLPTFFFFFSFCVCSWCNCGPNPSQAVLALEGILAPLHSSAVAASARQRKWFFQVNYPALMRLPGPWHWEAASLRRLEGICQAGPNRREHPPPCVCSWGAMGTVLEPGSSKTPAWLPDQHSIPQECPHTPGVGSQWVSITPSRGIGKGSCPLTGPE